MWWLTVLVLGGDPRDSKPQHQASQLKRSKPVAANESIL
jgi:hypothetical protein